MKSGCVHVYSTRKSRAYQRRQRAMGMMHGHQTTRVLCGLGEARAAMQSHTHAPSSSSVCGQCTQGSQASPVPSTTTTTSLWQLWSVVNRTTRLSSGVATFSMGTAITAAHADINTVAKAPLFACRNAILAGAQRFRAYALVTKKATKII